MVFLRASRYNMDMIYFILAIVIMFLSLFAQAHVQSVFQRYAQKPTARGIYGGQLAQELLMQNGLTLPIQPVAGELTDHFDPKNQVVGLSEAVYGSNSVSAYAVAAHEIGHVMQYQEDHPLMRIRSAILPAANLGSRIGPLLVMGGILISAFVSAAGNAGYYVALAGVALYAAVLLFQLVTLPVEFDASRRGLEMLTAGAYLTDEELPGAKKMLRAAALTYVLAALGSFVTVMRLLSFARSARRR